MKYEYIYENIQQLMTPEGYFEVCDGERIIPFSVMKNMMNDPAEVYECDENVIGTIHTDTNYHILIDTKLLEIGKEYMIQFSAGAWEYCDSDEHTSCYCTVIDNWVIGIGAYDPNDELKYEQMWEYSKQQGFLERGFCIAPSTYNESDFEKYTVDTLPDLKGYQFKLFDYQSQYIWFEVAWVKVKDYPVIEYKEALGLWLC